MTDPALTLALREMAPYRVGLTMRWRDLLFLHFACAPEEIRAHLPPGLTVDTFPDAEGVERAWVGLVPFRMEGVRPKGMPPFRPCEDFPETNVRTYCHVDGKDPGVWFFSLDASNPFACAFARRFFSLNYRHARMSVERSDDQVRYRSRRVGRPFAENEARCLVRDELGPATPGTFEFFLVERYLLYSAKGGKLYKGQVFHPPYQLREVKEFEVSGGLIEVNGLKQRMFSHAVFSDGLDVIGGRIARVE
ncbi:MAG TPA: DUF2071 domain-containing protein [Fimbriimonadaceae bacterium]|nr:DUF2071 domain-containing protein [Fimbriimonadaceae bacterium]